MLIRRYLEPILIILPPLALAAKPLGNEICVAACYDVLKSLQFTNQSEGNGTSCLNNLRVSSTFACVRVRCEDHDIEPGIAWWQKQCKRSSKFVSVARYHSFVDNTSLETLNSLSSVEYDVKGVFGATVLPSNDAWDVVYGTAHAYSLQRHLHETFRWIPYAFWALVFVVVTGHRVLESVSVSPPQSDAASQQDPHTKANFSYRPFTTWSSVFHNHVRLAPASGRRINRSLGWLTGGTRLQARTILCYIITHIATISVRYPTVELNCYYDSREIQRLRYVSDRIGVLMSSSLPFIWLFGARNNFFPWATGLSFGTLQLFHRWTALVFSIEVIIHGCRFTAYYLQENGKQGYKHELRDPLFVCGILAATAVWLMILLSWHSIRRWFYELFKVTHIALSVVLLVAYHKHVVSQFQGRYLAFLWVCVGLWCFDHASRVVRLLFVNWLKRAQHGMSTLAHVTYNPAAEIIRLTTPEARNAPVRPGTYYFVSLPSSSWRIWESHPFSAIPLLNASTPAPSVIASSGPSPPRAPERMNDLRPAAAGVAFLIRPKKGMTARLRNKLLASSAASITLHVLLEGPYGSHPFPIFNSSHFSSAILVAGGTGITATLPYLQSIIDQCQRDNRNGNVITKRVSLVWIAREEEFIRDVLKHELRSILQMTKDPQVMTKLRIEIQFFATRQQCTEELKTQITSTASPSTSERSSAFSPQRPDRQVSEKDTGVSIEKDALSDAMHPDHSTASSSVDITFARPDITRLISSFCITEPLLVASAGTKITMTDRTAVFACGPTRLAEEARYAARNQARARTEYFEQVHGW